MTFTHVEFPKGDRLGHMMAWFSLIPVFSVVAFLAIIVIRRDLTTIFFFIGFFVNEFSNQVLKRIIKEPRPSRLGQPLWSEYGMPSAHAQFMGFVTAFVILLFYVRIKVVTLIIPLAKLWKHFLTAACVLTSIVVSYSRIYLRYHTPNQVLVGLVLGLLFGALWFVFMEKIVGPYFPIIASMPICEMLLIKDFSLIPNALWCEYHCIKTEMRTRTKKYIRPE